VKVLHEHSNSLYKAVVVDDEKVLPFDTVLEAESYRNKKCPGAFVTILGDEDYKNRVLLEQEPLLSSYQIPPRIVLPPVSIAQFDSIIPKSMFYGSLMTPWMLLPIRLDFTSDLVFPIWFLPDTGSFNSFLEKETRRLLGLDVGTVEEARKNDEDNREFNLYLRDQPDAFEFGVAKRHFKNINLLGMKALARGKFVAHPHAKVLELTEVQPVI